MLNKMAPSSPKAGLLHQYTSRLTAFEYTPNASISSPPANTIIFIGGLFDGLSTVPYVSSISTSLPPSWSIAQVLLSSSYSGWGHSSLSKDVHELSKCVTYFRSLRPKGSIVLMGHSTGCQDVMEYLTGKGAEKRPKIDGAIIQAPVSDRESVAADMDVDVLRRSCEVAQSMVDRGEGGDILPGKEMNNVFPCPVTAYRWLSLSSPNRDGDDDYFSSDLTDAQLLKTFGALPADVPLCVLFSGADEYMPKSIDKEALLKRWIGVVKRGNGSVDEVHSGIVEGAKHNLTGDPEAVVKVLVQKVVGFVGALEVKSNL